jgi:hypothetical protein
MPQPLYSPKHEANFETLKDKVVPTYSREAYRGSGGIFPLTLNLALNQVE